MNKNLTIFLYTFSVFNYKKNLIYVGVAKESNNSHKYKNNILNIFIDSALITHTLYRWINNSTCLSHIIFS